MNATEYVSKPVKIQAVQWTDFDRSMGKHGAHAIVNWVNANGGEANYKETVEKMYGDARTIAVRTINGWAYATPGHYVVMGSATFDAPDAVNVITRQLRDFYPCDPETFEKRWEASK